MHLLKDSKTRSCLYSFLLPYNLQMKGVFKVPEYKNLSKNDMQWLIWNSEIGYLLLPSRNMAEILLKWRKS